MTNLSPYETAPVTVDDGVRSSLLGLLKPLEEEVLEGRTTSERTELTVLAGHLSVLAFELLTHPGCSTMDRHVAADVAWTLGSLGPDFYPFGQLANKMIKASDPYFPMRLSPEELQAAAHHLVSAARQLALPLPPALREDGLAWALVLPNPPVALTRTSQELLPLQTGQAGRVPREERLRARHAGARTPHEQYAAALLMYVNARDRHMGMPVLNILGQVRRHLLILKDLDREAEQALRPEFTGLHEELGRARLPHGRDSMVPRTKWSDVESLGLTYLRQLRSDRVMPLQDGWQDQELWRVFDVFDEHLQDKDTAFQDPKLRFQMILYGTVALTRMFRAPGMPLHPLAELATELVGIDPYWAWQDLQPDLERQHRLPDDLEHLAFASKIAMLVEWHAPHLGAFEAHALRLFRAVAGHVLATSRRWNIRLPEHTFIEEHLNGFGPLRASAWTPRERDTFLVELEALERELAAAIQHVPNASSANEDPQLAPEPAFIPALDAEADAELEQPFRHTPVHVREARALLEGKRVTLLGGVPRPAHHAALVRELGLAELDWVPSDAYQHGTHAAAHVPEDTGVVILAVRWMGHAHNALREIARERSVPYVMHPGGLNPSSVAYQVLRQVSEQLRAG